MELGNTKENPIIKFIDDWKFETASAGFSETVSFPFISEKDLENFNITSGHPLSQTVTLANPLVEERNLLRTSMIFSLVKNLQHNIITVTQELGYLRWVETSTRRSDNPSKINFQTYHTCPTKVFISSETRERTIDQLKEMLLQP